MSRAALPALFVLALAATGCGDDEPSRRRAADPPPSTVSAPSAPVATPGTPLALTPAGWPAPPVPVTERGTEVIGTSESVEYDTTATPVEVLDAYEPLLAAIDGATVERGGAQLSSDGHERLTGQIGAVVYEVVPHDGRFRITFVPD